MDCCVSIRIVKNQDKLLILTQKPAKHVMIIKLSSQTRVHGIVVNNSATESITLQNWVRAQDAITLRSMMRKTRRIAFLVNVKTRGND